MFVCFADGGVGGGGCSGGGVGCGGDGGGVIEVLVLMFFVGGVGIDGSGCDGDNDGWCMVMVMVEVMLYGNGVGSVGGVAVAEAVAVQVVPDVGGGLISPECKELLSSTVTLGGPQPL